jgi:CubicO group peptidase (beta-lactamase class C family)
MGLSAPKARPSRPTANGCARVDSAALERFLDERFGKGLEERLFPGAVFVFVQDGRVVLAKGFGLANVATGLRADPERTRFFGGSISKLITATAVVQLADRGLLDLDTDVNRYLTTVQVDSAFAEPITLRHLLTHTGGLDRRDIGMATRSRSSVLSLENYVRRDLTPRVEPAGEAFRYSNLGIALAGLVVQEVSGQPFTQYVNESIFAPLGMHHSSVDIPSEDGELTPGYTPLPGRGGWRPARHIYSHNVPAIGLRTTAHDMARLILANLNGGALDGHRILSDTATAMMHAAQFTADPRLNGSGLGFRYGERMGLRVIGHRGLINEHASIVDLIPETNAGFFVACNASDCARMEPMIDDLLDEFLCGRAQAPVTGPLARSAIPARELAGTYRPKRQSQRSVEKARGLFDEIELWARGDTLVAAPNIGPRQPQLLVPVAADEYALVSGGSKMVLVPTPSGEYRLFFSGLGFPQEELVRLSYFETRSFFMRMTLASTAGLASALALLPVVLIARRKRGSPGGKGVGLAAAVGGSVLSLVMLAFLHGMQRVLGGAVESEFIFGVPPSVRALLWLPVAAIVIALPLPALAVGLWRKRLWTVPERVYYVLLLIGTAALLLLLHEWNFIGLRF